MAIDLNEAELYVHKQIAAGKLTDRHIAAAVISFQREHALEVDGKPGPHTIAMLDAAVRQLGPQQVEKFYPLPVLPDGRKPQITSRFHTRNPDRPSHKGCDFFYRYDAAKDPPVKMGDGGATRGPDGKPKWFIPDKLDAIAAADGKVVRASHIATGFRVAIEHADGFETIYVHLRNIKVQVGQDVLAGAKVGEVGDNPIDTDAEHLHFEVSPAGRYAPVDPEEWLDGAMYKTL